MFYLNPLLYPSAFTYVLYTLYDAVGRSQSPCTFRHGTVDGTIDSLGVVTRGKTGSPGASQLR